MRSLLLLATVLGQALGSDSSSATSLSNCVVVETTSTATPTESCTFTASQNVTGLSAAAHSYVSLLNTNFVASEPSSAIKVLSSANVILDSVDSLVTGYSGLASSDLNSVSLFLQSIITAYSNALLQISIASSAWSGVTVSDLTFSSDATKFGSIVGDFQKLVDSEKGCYTSTYLNLLNSFIKTVNGHYSTLNTAIGTFSYSQIPSVSWYDLVVSSSTSCSSVASESATSSSSSETEASSSVESSSSAATSAVNSTSSSVELTSSSVESTSSSVVESSSSSVVESTSSSVVESTSSSVVESSSSAIVNSTSSVVEPSTSAVVNSTSSVVEPSTSAVVNSTSSSVVEPSTSAVVNSTSSSVVEPSTSAVVNSTSSSVVEPSTSAVVNSTTASSVASSVATSSVASSTVQSGCSLSTSTVSYTATASCSFADNQDLTGLKAAVSQYTSLISSAAFSTAAVSELASRYSSANEVLDNVISSVSALSKLNPADLTAVTLFVQSIVTFYSNCLTIVKTHSADWVSYKSAGSPVYLDVQAAKLNELLAALQSLVSAEAECASASAFTLVKVFINILNGTIASVNTLLGVSMPTLATPVVIATSVTVTEVCTSSVESTSSVQPTSSVETSSTAESSSSVVESSSSAVSSASSSVASSTVQSGCSLSTSTVSYTATASCSFSASQDLTGLKAAASQYVSLITPVAFSTDAVSDLAARYSSANDVLDNIISSVSALSKLNPADLTAVTLFVQSIVTFYSNCLTIVKTHSADWVSYKSAGNTIYLDVQATKLASLLAALQSVISSEAECASVSSLNLVKVFINILNSTIASVNTLLGVSMPTLATPVVIATSAVVTEVCSSAATSSASSVAPTSVVSSCSVVTSTYTSTPTGECTFTSVDMSAFSAGAAQVSSLLGVAFPTLSPSGGYKVLQSANTVLSSLSGIVNGFATGLNAADFDSFIAGISAIIYGFDAMSNSLALASTEWTDLLGGADTTIPGMTVLIAALTTVAEEQIAVAPYCVSDTAVDNLNIPLMLIAGDLVSLQSILGSTVAWGSFGVASIGIVTTLTTTECGIVSTTSSIVGSTVVSSSAVPSSSATTSVTTSATTSAVSSSAVKSSSSSTSSSTSKAGTLTTISQSISSESGCSYFEITTSLVPTLSCGVLSTQNLDPLSSLFVIVTSALNSASIHLGTPTAALSFFSAADTAISQFDSALATLGYLAAVDMAAVSTLIQQIVTALAAPLFSVQTYIGLFVDLITGGKDTVNYLVQVANTVETLVVRFEAMIAAQKGCYTSGLVRMLSAAITLYNTNAAILRALAPRIFVLPTIPNVEYYEYAIATSSLCGTSTLKTSSSSSTSKIPTVTTTSVPTSSSKSKSTGTTTDPRCPKGTYIYSTCFIFTSNYLKPNFSCPVGALYYGNTCFHGSSMDLSQCTQGYYYSGACYTPNAAVRAFRDPLAAVYGVLAALI